MLTGGVIMDVTNAEQAKIAEKAGDLGLLSVRYVHDYAAFEHFGQADFHAPLIRSFRSVAPSIRFLRVHFTSPLGSELFRPPNLQRLGRPNLFTPAPRGCAPLCAPRA